MCGIAGVLWRGSGPPGKASDLVSLALRHQRHRGPDDSGVVVLRGEAGEELGALGNVRLAIQDPSPAGHQPMEDGGRVLVINGELYNHRDVRQSLGAGSSWRSGSDTETLLRAHGRWGEACLGRFRGMFALALWDPGRRELWCARDRLGIKPLYYAATEQAFVFASELGALRATGVLTGPAGRLDMAGLASFVRFGAVSEPLTLLRGVRSLEAGSWLRVGAGLIVDRGTWWSPPLESGPAGRHAVDQVGAELARAVTEHLLSDVPVACLLSSGVDSSLVTALASRRGARPLRTFTLADEDPRLDESGPAAEIARACGTEHTTVHLSGGELAALVPRAVAAMDLPTQDGLNTWLISHAVARAGIKVVLSGLGGDELFGGYPSFRLVPLAERLSPVLSRMPGLVRLLLGRGGRGERGAALLARGATLSQRYEEVRALWSARELRELGVAPGAPLTDRPLGRARGGVAVSLLELSGYTRSTLLRDSDAMSMAHSLELRVPLLDHRLVETCLAARAAEGCGLRGHKAVLRALAARHLSPALLDRPKRGFRLPMERWLRGELRGFAREGLEALRAARTPLRIEGLEERFLAGALPWARLWQFVVLGHWLARHPEVA